MAVFRAVDAFSVSPLIQRKRFVKSIANSSQGTNLESLGLRTERRHLFIQMSKYDMSDNSLRKVLEDEEDVPIAFVDEISSTFIDCFADAVAQVGKDKYTIGSPCDHSVALCYFDDDDELVPVEIEEDLMNEVFPIAASIVEEEFGEELKLERTPQTLTLVGELEEGEADEESDDNENIPEDEEDVEILLTFEHKGKEFNLVRLIDPMLLVGRNIKDDDSKCVLLSPEEAEEILPMLEEMFLGYNN